MVILVDYDNVEPTDRARGVFNVVARVLDAIGRSWFTDGQHVRFRMYGGWYGGLRLTPRAQDLTADLQRTLPFPFTLANGSSKVRLRVSGELAHGLAADPGGVLVNTFRVEAAEIGRLKCSIAPYSGCADPRGCGLLPALDVVRGEACPVVGCSVGLSHVLTKPQQKLVDTMLTADLIHFATHGERSVGVVSSDDDLWPGIKAALLHGARVAHVHTKLGGTPMAYAERAGAAYTQHSIR